MIRRATKVQEDPVLIAVMGGTGTGKTTLINLASGSNLAVGHSMESCTSEVVAAEPFHYGNKVVTLIDTPGFDGMKLSEADVLKQIGEFKLAAIRRTASSAA